jgi:hypothetical protein
VHDHHPAWVPRVVTEDDRDSGEERVLLVVEGGAAVRLVGRGIGAVDRWGFVADLGRVEGGALSAGAPGHLAPGADPPDAEAGEG